MENLINSLLETNLSKYSLKNVFLITAICLFCTWLIQYHWRRRRLYKFAAKCDGPFAFPIVGNGLLLAGSVAGAFKNLCNLGKYKSPCRFWLGQALLFFIDDPKQIEILANCLDKHDLMKFMRPLAGNGLITSDVAEWKLHRKIINPTFNQKILNTYVSTFVKQGNVLINNIERGLRDKNFDIGSCLDHRSLDMFLETAMGLNEDSQIDGSYLTSLFFEWLEIIVAKMFNVLYHSDFIYGRTQLFKMEQRTVKKLHTITDDIVKEKIQEYRKIKSDKEDNPESYSDDDAIKRNTFLEQLVELSEEGADLTIEDIRYETITLMIAGSETTAKANAFLMMTLGMFPNIQERLYEEVMDVLGPEREVDYTDMNKFPFLDRVIKETLRLFPIAPLFVRNIFVDVELGNFTIPQGSGVGVHIFNLHRNPKIWPDPLKFNPDRFLPEEVAKRHPYSWIPFAAGPRNCIGLKYAMMSMRTTLVTLIRRFKFHTAYRNIEDVELSFHVTMVPINGYKLSFEVRE